MSTDSGMHQDLLKGNDPIHSRSDPFALPMDSPEPIVPPQPREFAPFRRLDPAPLEMFKNDAVLANLLRAVESSNLAFELQESKPVSIAASEPAPLEPKGSAASESIFIEIAIKQPPSEPRTEETPSSTIRQSPKPPDLQLPKPAPVEFASFGLASPATEISAPAIEPQHSKPISNAVPDPPLIKPQKSATGEPFTQFVPTQPLSGSRLEGTRPLTILEVPIASVTQPANPQIVEPASFDLESFKRATSDLKSSRLGFPVSSDPLLPMFSISSNLQKQETAEGHSLYHVPAPLPESDAINWELDCSPFKPPAPVEDQETPLVARLNGRLRRLAPKIGLPVTLASHVEQSIAWLWDEPAEEPQGPTDPRLRQRLLNPPLIAYYWTGGTPKPDRVADLSSTGLYLLTNNRWRPGTRIWMTLVRTDLPNQSPGSSLAVDFVIVRWGRDGLGGAFIPFLPGSAYGIVGGAVSTASKPVLERFVDCLSGQDQPMVGASSPDSENS